MSGFILFSIHMMNRSVFKKYKSFVPLIGLLILTYVCDVEGAECKCPPITPTRGVALTCKNSQGEKINCSTPALPHTSISYKCQPFYRPALRRRLVHRRLQCTQDCIWHNMRRLEEFICEIDCGKPTQPHVSFIALGQKTLRYSWPWHATIFVNDSKSMQNHYICGGTLINENIVLTAAHCLITLRQYSLESYNIVIGSISSNWTENVEDENTQFFRIKCSYVPAEYDHVEQRSDIALVELDKSIALSETVSPACFPYDIDFAKPLEPVVAGEGEVVGYGKNEYGVYEKYLKYTRLPVIGAAKCYEITEKRQGIEQFCAGVENGSSVCSGDSGGGMFFRGQGMSRYYVQGIVSHGLHNRGKVTCDGISYFTKVLYFTKWVTEAVDKIEEKNEWISDETISTPSSVIPSSVSANNFFSECTEILLEEDGTNILCSHQNNHISCVNASTGTIAFYTCKYRYRPALLPATRRECRNGIWTERDTRFQCVLQCGLGGNYYPNENQSKLINLPWNVGLYEKFKWSEGFEYSCGGTLISPRAVITTASCVTAFTPANITIMERNDVILFFGKLSKRIDINHNEEVVQMRRVEQIHVHESYTSYLAGSNLAVLITDSNVEMTKNVGPVCLPSRTSIENELGSFIGFETDTDEIIKETSIPVLGSDTCDTGQDILSRYTRRFQHTALCAGRENGILVCTYSGTGLYFEGMPMKWELYGMLREHEASVYGGCYRKFITSFVKVMEFKDWILDKI